MEENNKKCRKCGGESFYKCGGCKQCKKIKNQEWVARNREKYLDYMRDANKKHAQSKKLYHEANMEERLKKDRERYSTKKHVYAESRKSRLYSGKTYREYCNERMREWKRNNKHKTCSNEAFRRSMLINATPKWSNKRLINDVYLLSSEKTKNTGIKHHVDHIIPLIGKNVCGLHVHGNLRVITAEENIYKSNKSIVTDI